MIPVVSLIFLNGCNSEDGSESVFVLDNIVNVQEVSRYCHDHEVMFFK